MSTTAPIQTALRVFHHLEKDGLPDWIRDGYVKAYDDYGNGISDVEPFEAIAKMIREGCEDSDPPLLLMWDQWQDVAWLVRKELSENG
jgi:hypothetical protein